MRFRFDPRPLFASILLLTIASPLMAQKTDTLVARNGDVMTGEIKEYKRGLVKFSTDVAGTIYVKWTRVLNAKTDKTFEIDLEDGTKVSGSLAFGDEPRQVKVVVDGDTLVVGLEQVVNMARIKETFWKRLDGSINLGAGFTQQNAKTDLNFDGEVRYRKDRNLFTFGLSTSFSRQDDTDNISRLNAAFLYLREFADRWFYAGVAAAEQNSQLSLALRGTAGATAGRFFVRSNKVILLAGLGLSYARERFTGQEGDNAFQGIILADFQFFTFEGKTSDLSSELLVFPVFNQAGRWRISSITSFRQKIVTDFYFNFSINNQFDSKPPTEGTEKNDLSLTTSFGWSY